MSSNDSDTSRIFPTKAKLVKLPYKLTAENGAKGLLSGEFFEDLEVACPDCDSEYPEGDCMHCEGHGQIIVKVPVSWTTIKDIYKKIVEHMAV